MRWVIAACFLLPLVASGARADQINLLSPPMITNAGLKEINARYADIDRKIETLTKAVWAVGSIFGSAFIAIFSILATR